MEPASVEEGLALTNNTKAVTPYVLQQVLIKVLEEFKEQLKQEQSTK